jgi:radical SAM superfamily enzyme YgiQ (UPF0313 family)
MAALSQKLSAHKLHVEQVQDFTPTPMTHSSVMYYTKKELERGKNIFVAQSNTLKIKQKDYFFSKK